MSETKNPDLTELHAMLGDIVDALVLKQEEATDPAIIKAIGDEIRETLFRVTNVQKARFKSQTDKVSAAVAKVKEAEGDLNAAMDEIDHINKFIKTISSFLGLVDKVIDLVKII
jgi:hypothetical protein